MSDRQDSKTGAGPTGIFARLQNEYLRSLLSEHPDAATVRRYDTTGAEDIPGDDIYSTAS